MKSTTEKGRKAEDQAVQFLMDLGYVIVTRRYKRAGGEIDIVALDGDVLVFVEVKARAGTDPVDALTEKKANRILQVAHIYQNEMGIQETSLRFDLIAVEGGAIQHHRGFICG